MLQGRTCQSHANHTDLIPAHGDVPQCAPKCVQHVSLENVKTNNRRERTALGGTHSVAVGLGEASWPLLGAWMSLHGLSVPGAQDASAGHFLPSVGAAP